MTFAILAGLTVIVAVVVLAARRWAIRRLDWPAEMGHAALCHRVNLYVRAQGWESQKRNGLEFDYLVKKNDHRLAITCYPTGFPISASAFAKYTQRKMEIHPSWLFVIVCAAPVPVDVMDDAARRGMYVLYYKKLQPLLALHTPSRDAVETLFKAMIAEGTVANEHARAKLNRAAYQHIFDREAGQ